MVLEKIKIIIDPYKSSILLKEYISKVYKSNNIKFIEIPDLNKFIFKPVLYFNKHIVLVVTIKKISDINKCIDKFKKDKTNTSLILYTDLLRVNYDNTFEIDRDFIAEYISKFLNGKRIKTILTDKFLTSISIDRLIMYCKQISIYRDLSIDDIKEFKSKIEDTHTIDVHKIAYQYMYYTLNKIKYERDKNKQRSDELSYKKYYDLIDKLYYFSSTYSSESIKSVIKGLKSEMNI